jgi:transposase
MASSVQLRDDYDAGGLRELAKRSRDPRQIRRLLALAAVYDGMSRASAAQVGGMDRQTLRDWVHRFNAEGLEGLYDRRRPGPAPRLTPAQEAELGRVVCDGPDLERDGVVRWRRVDLQVLINERFEVVYHERTVGKVLHRLGFSHVSTRARHPEADEQKQEAFKKTSPRW